MKIGQAAREYGVSIDTLNYYVKLGLLAPPQKGGQRDFDGKTQAELKLILELKELRFSLGEIHRILSLMRISGLASKEDVSEIVALYRSKKQECIGEAEQLQNAARALDNRISELNCRLSDRAPATGVPLNMLELLRCPLCGGELGIRDVSMNSRYIFSGKLDCPCGYRAEIRNGILLTPNRNTDLYDRPDVDRAMYKALPPRLISLFQHSYNWMGERIGEIGFAHKVVLETYVNAWFFLHNNQQRLDPRGRYIAVDKYPETLLSYKEIIEQQNRGLDVLYIADSSTNLPLRPGCVDVNIDFFALNEHNFYHRSFLPDRLAACLAPDAQLLGTYFYFENGRRSLANLLREYPTCAPSNFDVSGFRRSLAAFGYNVTCEEDVGFTTDSGDNIGFSFHAPGERMHLLCYLARRNGKQA